MFNETRKIALRILGTVVFIAIIIFIYFKYKPYIEGPKITTINIESFMRVREPSIKIHGEIVNTQSIEINGRDIFLNEKKSFDEIIVFAKGLNTIDIKLTDTFGNSNDYQYRIYYGTEQSFPITLNDALLEQRTEFELGTEKNTTSVASENDEKVLLENTQL